MNGFRRRPLNEFPAGERDFVEFAYSSCGHDFDVVVIALWFAGLGLSAGVGPFAYYRYADDVYFGYLPP